MLEKIFTGIVYALVGLLVASVNAFIIYKAISTENYFVLIFYGAGFSYLGWLWIAPRMPVSRKRREEIEAWRAEENQRRQIAEQQERERKEREHYQQLAAVNAAEERRVAEEARRKEVERQRQKAQKKAAQDAFWNSPEGQKVKAAQMLAKIERQKAIDAANIKIMEQERIAEIARGMRREEREDQEELIKKVKDL